MYEIYIRGTVKPLWKYKTKAGVNKRLRKIAELRTLRSVDVRQISFLHWGYDLWTRVYFDNGKIIVI